MNSVLEEILEWVKVHSPQTYGHLQSPASEEQVLSVEQAVGATLPDSFKELLFRFNGDDGLTWLAFLGNGNQLLPCQQIVEYYTLEQTTAAQFYKPEYESVEFWLDRVANKIMFVKGPVKPLTLHPNWIPITSMNGDVCRYLDYDPAEGGEIGQVIEVDAECCTYQVLASNFEAFLAVYAQQLRVGLYKVDDEGFIECDNEEDVLSWGVPSWLSNVT